MKSLPYKHGRWEERVPLTCSATGWIPAGAAPHLNKPVPQPLRPPRRFRNLRNSRLGSLRYKTPTRTKGPIPDDPCGAGLSRTVHVRNSVQQPHASAPRARSALHAGRRHASISSRRGPAPNPVLRARAESGRDGVVADVAADPCLLVVVADPVAVRLGLPEASLGHTNEWLGAARRVLLPAFKNISDRPVGRWPEQDMNVVWHHHPLAQKIPIGLEMRDRATYRVRHFRPTQVASSVSLVEVTLHSPMKVAVDVHLGIANGVALPHGFLPAPQPFTMLCLELEQHLSAQRVGKAKRDEIRGALSLDVGKVTARMHAGTQRIGNRWLHTRCSQFVTHSLHAAVRLVVSAGLHGPRLDQPEGRRQLWSDFSIGTPRSASSCTFQRLVRSDRPAAQPLRTPSRFGNSRLGSLRYRTPAHVFPPSSALRPSHALCDTL